MGLPGYILKCTFGMPENAHLPKEVRVLIENSWFCMHDAWKSKKQGTCFSSKWGLRYCMSHSNSTKSSWEVLGTTAPHPLILLQELWSCRHAKRPETPNKLKRSKKCGSGRLGKMGKRIGQNACFPAFLTYLTADPQNLLCTYFWPIFKFQAF